MAKTSSKTSSKATSKKAPQATSKAPQTLKASNKAPQVFKAPQASQKASKATSKASQKATSQKASQSASKKAPVNFSTQAQVVPVVAGLKGSVKHRATFNGADLTKDLQAASQFGDSYILQTSQLDKATKAAIQKALYSLPVYKGLHWALANLQIVPDSGPAKK